MRLAAVEYLNAYVWMTSWPQRLSGNKELAAGCRPNPQAGSLRYIELR
jgi:hypothetical protein